MAHLARYAKGVVVGVALLTLTACTTQFRNHGYAPSDDQLAEILVGIDTRDTVADVIGPPTASGVLNEGGYFYVQSRFRYFGPLEPTEVEREVVAIRFDGDGVVSNVERFGLDDGQVVALSRRVTQDNVRDTTFIRQLFGALGRFDAGTVLGDE